MGALGDSKRKGGEGNRKREDIPDTTNLTFHRRKLERTVI